MSDRVDLCYNAAGVTLAMAGLITPVVAAVLMPCPPSR